MLAASEAGLLLIFLILERQRSLKLRNRSLTCVYRDEKLHTLDRHEILAFFRI